MSAALLDMFAEVSRFINKTFQIKDHERERYEALAIFLAIKIYLQDWRGEFTSPSKSIQVAWRAFVSSNETYVDFCGRFCDYGQFLHYCDDLDCEKYLTTYMFARHCYIDPIPEHDKEWPLPILLQ